MKNFSKFINLNVADFIKGGIVAVLAAIVGLISSSLNAGSLNFDWKAIGHAALVAALAYLTKNFLTNSKNQFLSKEQK